MKAARTARTTRRWPRRRGATLLEIMLSMAVILVGMLGLFRVISVASVGSQQSQRMTQGLSRAQLVLESMRTAPQTVLDCLITNNANGWSNCEKLCLQWMANNPNQKGATPSTQACTFSTLQQVALDKDGTQQSYSVVYDSGSFQDGSSWVQNVSESRLVYDAQVTIGWTDDGKSSDKIGCGPGKQHCVTLRTAIFRDPR